MPTSSPAYLPILSTREDYFDHLEGYALSTAEEAEERHSRRPLVKTYMLETVAHGTPMPDISAVFP